MGVRGSDIASDPVLWISHLKQDEVLLDLSVVVESTQGVDGLVSKVVVSDSVVLHKLKQNKVEKIIT